MSKLEETLEYQEFAEKRVNGDNDNGSYVRNLGLDDFQGDGYPEICLIEH